MMAPCRNTFSRPVKSGWNPAETSIREPTRPCTSAVPRAYVEQRAVRSSEREKIIGVRAGNALKPQDTLLWSDLSLGNEERELSSLVQPGRRAVTVRASQAGSDPAGNGLVRPGDYVDVTITAPCDLNTIVPNGFYRGRNLTSTASMMIEF